VRVQEVYAGKAGRCPHCGKKLRVPPLPVFELEGVECEGCGETLSVSETLHIIKGHIYCANCFANQQPELANVKSTSSKEQPTKQFFFEEVADQKGAETQAADKSASSAINARASIRKRVTLECDKRLASAIQSLISREQYIRVLSVQRETGESVVSAIVNLGIAEEKDIGNALSKATGLPFSTAKVLYVDKGVIGLLPVTLLKSYELIPLSRSVDTITVAMVNPLDNEAIEEIENLTNLRANIIICTLSGFRQTLSRYFS
jgi:hypothetical protein